MDSFKMISSSYGGKMHMVILGGANSSLALCTTFLLPSLLDLVPEFRGVINVNQDKFPGFVLAFGALI